MALKLKRSVAELEASISVEEMLEWRYYFSTTPTSEDKIVQHIALQTANLLAFKGAKNVSYTDFMFDYEAKEEKKSPKDVKAKLLEQLLGEM